MFGRKSARVGLTPLLLVAAAVAVATAAPAEAGESKELELKAIDGVRVFADLQTNEGGRERPLVMLFHQAGSNAAEYSPIVPKVAALGFDTLSVDSRSGGRMFDRNNRTVMALGRAQPFDAAYADLEAALTWSRQAGYPGAVAWGSSYTAALVFRLAAEHDTVRAVLSFSPGEHLGDGERVRGYAARVTVPVFVTSAPGQEIRAAARILDQTDSGLVSHHRPRIGVHGSSALRSDRNPEGYLDYWTAVETFLKTWVLSPSLSPSRRGRDPGPS